MNRMHGGGNDMGRRNNQLERGRNTGVGGRGDNGRGGGNYTARHQTGRRGIQRNGNDKRRLESHTNPNGYEVNRKG